MNSVLLGTTLVLFSLPFLMVAVALILNRVPLLADPGLGVRLKTYLTTHVAEVREDHPFPELRPRTWKLPSERMRVRVEQAIADLGWQRVSSGSETEELRALVQTPLMGFKDDIAIGLKEAEAAGTILFARSVSRVGKGDLGANTKHILDLYRELDRLDND